MPQTKPFLSVHSLSHTYHTNSGETPALRDIHFDLFPGEFAAIVGPSGCGKSTLLELIAGLIPIETGSLLYPACNKTPAIGYMLQKDLLLPWRSIQDNIILGATLRHIPARQARKQAAPLLERYDLSEFARSRPHELSGGMRQRAALLRTLLTEKETLLLDEPFGALDALTRLQLQMDLTDMWQEFQKTILLVTHDVEEALLLSDEILVLSHRPGRLKKRVAVPLPRPREPDMLALPEAMEIKRELLHLLLREKEGTA